MINILIPSTFIRAILAAFLFMSVGSAQSIKNGLWTYIIENGGATTTSYDNGAAGAVTIPSSMDGLPVLKIGESTFSQYNGNINTYYGNNSITSVTIPPSVTSIGTYAFANCINMTSVTFGNSLTSIGYGSFLLCSGLTSVTIPSSVTSISAYAFDRCSGLTNVTIGSSVTSIGNYAFNGCSSLTSVTIPNSVTSFESGAFDSCPSLTSVYFQGNAPTFRGNWYWTPATFYYKAGATGWGSTFAGRPAVQAVVASITSQPVNVTTLQGTRATFTVTTSASGVSGYQWQKNGVNIPLATSATLTLSNVQQADSTNYKVIISNFAGDVTSDSTSLTVLPDSDLDGLSDAAEAGYGTNPNNADSDGDGLSDRAEIQVYLTNALVKDTDGDGFEDDFEVSTGFNPAQASSSPDSVSTIGNAVGFRFNAGLGMSYRIEDSSDLQNWSTLETPIIGDGGVVTRFYFTEGQAKRYFRVRKN